MTQSPTFRKLEAAHSTIARVAGELALLMERHRGLSRAVLREQAEELRRAAAVLETMSGGV